MVNKGDNYYRQMLLSSTFLSHGHRTQQAAEWSEAQATERQSSEGQVQGELD